MSPYRETLYGDLSDVAPVKTFWLLGPKPECPRCGSKSTRVSLCKGKRAWFWNLVGPKLCPTSRLHVHARCADCDLEWLEVTPEQPTPGDYR